MQGESKTLQSAEICESDGASANFGEHSDAGTPAGIFLLQLVPIADRHGARHWSSTSAPGDFTGRTAESNDDEGLLWISLAAMLNGQLPHP